MTNRKKKLGVTEYGYNRGIVCGEFLADYEAFKAKAATIKKGQYSGRSIARAWFPEFADYDLFIDEKLEEMKPFLFGITVNLPDNFNYTDTFGLDCLIVK